MVALIKRLAFLYGLLQGNITIPAEAQCKGQPGGFMKTNLNSEKSIILNFMIFVDLTRFCPNFGS